MIQSDFISVCWIITLEQGTWLQLGFMVCGLMLTLDFAEPPVTIWGVITNFNRNSSLCWGVMSIPFVSSVAKQTVQWLKVSAAAGTACKDCMQYLSNTASKDPAANARGS